MGGTIQWNPGGASAESHAPPITVPCPEEPGRKGEPSTRSRRLCLWGRRVQRHGASNAPCGLAIQPVGWGIQASVSLNTERRQERAGESEASGSPRPRKSRILPVALPAISRTAASVDPLPRLS